jgi:hypothetical protein
MVSPSANDPNWTGPKLFTYLRYDPDVSTEGLHELGLDKIDPKRIQVMDSVNYIDDIQRVGSAYAVHHVKPIYLEGFV